jgi:hypothetical protein
MSSGPFNTNARYELDAANGGYIVKARVQPETLAATANATANAIPAGAVDLSIHAYASKGKKEYGIRMRYVIVDKPAATPTGYAGEPLRFPVMTPATFAAWSEGDTVSYLGTDYEIIDKVIEDLQ